MQICTDEVSRNKNKILWWICLLWLVNFTWYQSREGEPLVSDLLSFIFIFNFSPSLLLFMASFLLAAHSFPQSTLPSIDTAFYLSDRPNPPSLCLRLMQIWSNQPLSCHIVFDSSSDDLGICSNDHDACSTLTDHAYNLSSIRSSDVAVYSFHLLCRSIMPPFRIQFFSDWDIGVQ